MIRRGVLASSVLLLSGCPWWGAPAPHPSQAPTAAPTAAPAPTTPSSAHVFESGLAIVGGVINVRVQDASQARIAGATVTLQGPTPAWGITGSANDVQFNPLEGGSYSLLISAPGYATQVSGLTLDPKTPLGQTLTLTPQGGVVSGRIVQASGTPLAGARISSGPVGVLTGADGTFTLGGLPPGSSTLTVAKTGFAQASTRVELAGDATVGDVALTPQGVIVSFENATQAFGGSTVALALQPLRTALGGAGFSVVDGDSNATVRVVASPIASVADDATVERLRSFVSAGGKLVLLGEWGGTFDYAPEALNRLARPYGCAFNSDLVRSSVNAGQPEWVRVTALDAIPGTLAMPSGITLFGACSIFAPPSFLEVAAGGVGAYRVASVNGGPVLAIARVYGAGLVVAVGDTSAWSTGSITGNQPTGGNLAETSNREFMLNLFSW